MCVFSPHSGAITVLSLLMLMSSIASQALCVCVCVYVCESTTGGETDWRL